MPSIDEMNKINVTDMVNELAKANDIDEVGVVMEFNRHMLPF